MREIWTGKRVSRRQPENVGDTCPMRVTWQVCMAELKLTYLGCHFHKVTAADTADSVQGWEH